MNYHDITKEDMNNGDGLRSVLWLAGCSHHCKGCQNPQTWDENGGILFDKNAEEELFKSFDVEYISGLTLTGGDPLFIGNRTEVARIIAKFRELYGSSKTIWMWTGYDWEDIYTLPYIKDIDILIDGKFILEQLDVSLKWKGSKNQRVIDVKKTFLSDNPSIPVLYTTDIVNLDEASDQYFKSKQG